MRVAVVSGAAPGHAFPAAALVRALLDGGHDALLLTGQQWLPALGEGLGRARLVPVGAPSTG